jgi:A/G-specific adenine glycosylase
MPRQTASPPPPGIGGYRTVVPSSTAVPAVAPPWHALQEAVLGWYTSHGRRLAFRGTRDPYAILVSEAMAQQTQAVRAGEAWIRFMDTFPTVASLASATPADVLRAWQGLGYNRRALNLWRAARRILDVHDGRVPSDLDALQELPGVGRYTARAIAAIAFGQPVAAVDTNVRRVIGRIVAGDVGVLAPSAMQNVADEAVPGDRPGAWTHAVMDLGATICLPRRPDCEACPAATWCRYADRARTGADGASAPAASEARMAGSKRAVREAAPAFPTTSRWLRGRIVDRLRSAGHAEWTVIEGPIGTHDGRAVIVALDALANEGMVELDGSDITGVAGRRARLPVG